LFDKRKKSKIKKINLNGLEKHGMAGLLVNRIVSFNNNIIHDIIHSEMPFHLHANRAD
jgi:hypothetical protein